MGVIGGASERGTAAETFRRLYWDTALSWHDPVLNMLRAVVGVDHVLRIPEHAVARLSGLR